ncbi:MAG: hypothetical protein JWR23_2142 [Mucilaginibacter sp.]|nr:hypothetical protein [Mucilaginibacter sp.]
MKLHRSLLVLLSVYFNCGHAQNIIAKYPFNLDILEHFSVNLTNDTIIPIYKKRP